MRIGKVIGTVTCGRLHPSLAGGQLKLVIPFKLNDLLGEDESVADASNDEPELSHMELLRRRTPKGRGTELVVYDELSAGVNEWIAFSEGAEASMPFYPNNKAVDAYASAIIDQLELEPGVLDGIRF